MVDEIPKIGLGTWHMTSPESAQNIKNGLSLGYNHLDCAYAYQNASIIKSALTGFPREKVFVTSKLWNSHHFQAEEALRWELSATGLDFFDLYLIHWPICWKPDHKFSPEEFATQSNAVKYPVNAEGVGTRVPFEGEHLKKLWKEMESFVEKGLVKHIGVSNFSIKQLEEVMKYAKIKPYCNQVECHPFFRQNEMRSFLHANGMRLVAFSPLGGGNKELFTNSTLKKIAEKYNKTVPIVCLKWGISKGNVVIPKSDTEELQKANLEADFEVNKEEWEEDIKEIEKIPEKRGFTPK